MRRWLLVGLALIGVMSSAGIATAKPAVGPAVASPYFGAPLPENATPDAKHGDLPSDPPADGDSTLYRLPRGITSNDARSWYGVELPWGESWGEWKWCGQYSNRGKFWQQSYNRGDDALTVSLPANNGKKYRTGIIWGYEANSPCS